MDLPVDPPCAKRIINGSPSMGFDLYQKQKSSSGVDKLFKTERDADTKNVEAKRSNFGAPSPGTGDYRHRAEIRPEAAMLTAQALKCQKRREAKADPKPLNFSSRVVHQAPFRGSSSSCPLRRDARSEL